MKTSHTKDVTVTLVLTEAEAAWLHVNMQNPLHGEHPEDESTEDRAYRHEFFLATQGPF